MRLGEQNISLRAFSKRDKPTSLKAFSSGRKPEDPQLLCELPSRLVGSSGLQWPAGFQVSGSGRRIQVSVPSDELDSAEEWMESMGISVDGADEWRKENQR